MVTHNLGKSLVNWFSNKKIMLNTDKCHRLLNSQEPNTLKIGDLQRNNPQKISEVSEFLILPITKIENLEI